MTDYETYRGKCKEFAEQLCHNNLELTLVRGWYVCPIWGKQQHWWTKDLRGNIIDPAKKQFPSKGMGEYIEYAGILSCEYCGESITEEEAYFVEHHVYCSGTCYGHDVGF